MHCQALRNVPRQKLDIELESLSSQYEDKEKVALMKKAIHRYFEANIPVMYWALEMKNFTGDPSVLQDYKYYINDIPGLYKNGLAVCFAGSHGVGKTFMVTSILKRVLEKGYSGLYVNLSDVISTMGSGEKFAARKELLNVDFLVVDEFDPRYMGSDAAADFYGRVLEDILRHRTQNRLPLILCSNSPNPEEAFSGDIHASIKSIWNFVEVIPVLGNDYRANKNVVK